jgi:hypothetical protein
MPRRIFSTQTIPVPELIDPADIANQTLAHYDQRADDFWEGTRDHDVSQNIEALLKFTEGPPAFTILDFGCGPGRDLKTHPR